MHKHFAQRFTSNTTASQHHLFILFALSIKTSLREKYNLALHFLSCCLYFKTFIDERINIIVANLKQSKYLWESTIWGLNTPSLWTVTCLHYYQLGIARSVKIPNSQITAGYISNPSDLFTEFLKIRHDILTLSKRHREFLTSLLEITLFRTGNWCLILFPNQKALSYRSFLPQRTRGCWCQVLGSIIESLNGLGSRYLKDNLFSTPHRGRDTFHLPSPIQSGLENKWNNY